MWGNTITKTIKKYIIGLLSVERAAVLAKLPKIVPQTEAFQVIRKIAPSPITNAAMKHRIKTETLLISNDLYNPALNAAPPAAFPYRTLIWFSNMKFVARLGRNKEKNEKERRIPKNKRIYTLNTFLWVI